jgi:hypothetical protein
VSHLQQFAGDPGTAEIEAMVVKVYRERPGIPFPREGQN